MVTIVHSETTTMAVFEKPNREEEEILAKCVQKAREQSSDQKGQVKGKAVYDSYWDISKKEKEEPEQQYEQTTLFK